MSEDTKSQSQEYDMFTVKLGDIIEIVSPTNEQLNEYHFFIKYVDESRIELVNISSLEEIQLNKNERGELTDQSISEVNLVSRAEEEGYAKQNNLLPGSWVEVHINGEIASILTGEITNLEEDQIEITLYPELQVIYIDFEYKGLPDNIPIEKFVIRDKPSSLKDIDTIADLPEQPTADSPSEDSEIKESYIDYLETGEVEILVQENAEHEENVLEKLRNMVTQNKSIIYDEELEDVSHFIEIPDSQKRYDIQIQINSLLDELLSTIPSAKRTPNLVNKIHVLIERYRELRELYSQFDENGVVRNFKKNDPTLHKPIIPHIENMDMKFRWLIPVVKRIRNIYDAEDHAFDANNLAFDRELKNEENMKKDIYYNSNSVNDESKYINLHRQLAHLMRPFENLDENAASFLQSDEVRANIEAIVDNYDDFYSSVVTGTNQMNVVKKQFVIQTYNLGLNRLVERKSASRNSTSVVPIGPADTMSVTSFLMMPLNTVNYSRIDLPGSSILEKSNFDLQPILLFRFLYKNPQIVPYIVDDLSKEIDFENDAEFSNSIVHFSLSKDLAVDSDIFNQFLQSIIPKTRTLIRIIRKHVKNKLSFLSVVRYLEPYMVYSTDISYKQYMEIRHFIIEQIKERKDVMETKRKEFSFLTNARYKIESKSLLILQLLLENADLMELFMTGYKMPNKEFVEAQFFSTEVLEMMLKKDNAVLFTKLLSSLMSSLMTPDSLTDIFTATDDAEDKIKKGDCKKRVITKRYHSIAELQKDNHKDIYYDPEFDKTPYHILEKYKNEQTNMLASKFVSFLAENLVQLHDCPRNKSVELAKLLIAGQKEVEAGEYALLVLKKDGEEPEYKYYYRKNNNWVHHEDVDEMSFVDTNDMFCNMNKKCVANQKTDSCDSIKETEKRLKKDAYKKIANEFDRRFQLSTEEMKSNLEKSIGEHIRYLHRKLRLQAIKEERVNNYSYTLGSIRTAESEGLIQSPHADLRDLILGQDDFVKKQHDIVKLYEVFCREPLDTLDESPYWKYCVDTNTKLLPGFLYDLASCFVNGGDYNLKLEQICFTNGAKSDSGNMIEDKYSGYMIRMIEYSDEEGYNEAGFKVSTHAFIGEQTEDKVLNDLMNPIEKPFLCENPQSQLICDVLTSLGKNLGIPVDDRKEMVVRLSATLCDKLIVDEAAYIKQAKKEEEKKGVKLPPYKKRANQLTIMITTISLFVSLQTEIPPFSTKYLVPGCIKSFRGYPLTGEEDTSGIQYMACVLNKMKSAYEPWDSIKKSTTDMISEQLKKIAASSLKNTEIDQLYIQKREYMLANPQEDIPNVHAIEKWVHFLPPLIDTKAVSGLRTIPKEFKDDFMVLLKKGKTQQHHDYFVFQNKIAYYGYSVIEAIQALVKEKTLLLKAVSTGVPFLQNACCNESIERPIEYFIKENANIENYLKTVENLSAIVKNVAVLSKAPMLYDRRSTSVTYPSLSNSISEENIYAAVIHYCNLNRKTEIPQEFHRFFSEIPARYDPKASLHEKMEFLKRSGKQFGEKQLHELMGIVHKRNIVHVYEDPKANPIEMMKDMLSLFETHESPVIDENLRENLLSVLETFDKTKLMTIADGDDVAPKETTANKGKVKRLKDELAESIEKVFKPQVLKFLKKYGKIKGSEYKSMESFFQTFVHSWENDNLHQTAQFITSSVNEMSRVIPNIIVSNTSMNQRFPKHFEKILSMYDKSDIVQSQMSNYADYDEFKQDSVLTMLLHSIQAKTVDIQLFLSTIPIQEPVMKNGREYFSLFDKDTIKLLLEYIFLSVIHEYIIATDDAELLRTDLIEKKKTAREMIMEQRDMSIQFQSELSAVDEEAVDLQDNYSEIQIRLGNKEELKTRCAKLLIAMIQNVKKNKDLINMSYSSITDAIRKKKENEKNRIVRRFENLTKDEVEIENMRKKYKLDEWNVGQQRGLFVYDAKVSERERMEQEAEDAIAIEKHGLQNQDILESIEEVEDEEEPEEDMGIGSLKPNFFDGQFYSDDESDDDFGDDA